MLCTNIDHEKCMLITPVGHCIGRSIKFECLVRQCMAVQMLEEDHFAILQHVTHFTAAYIDPAAKVMKTT